MANILIVICYMLLVSIVIRQEGNACHALVAVTFRTLVRATRLAVQLNHLYKLVQMDLNLG